MSYDFDREMGIEESLEAQELAKSELAKSGARKMHNNSSKCRTQPSHLVYKAVIQISDIHRKLHWVKLTLECGHTKEMTADTYLQFHRDKLSLCIPCSDKRYELEHPKT